MRTYWENGASFTEFQHGGPDGAEVDALNILSGFGYANIPIPSYEGGSLATWKARHFKRIRIMDDTATNTLWEGFIDEVKLTQHGVLLICLEPQARLYRSQGDSWADYKRDHGVVTSVSGDTITDDSKAWSVNEHQNKGVVILNRPAPVFTRQKTQMYENRIGADGNVLGDIQLYTGDNIANTEGLDYFNVQYNIATSEEYWFKTLNDDSDLSKITVHYNLKIDWTGNNPSAKLQVWDGTDWTTEVIINAFADNVAQKGSHDITESITDYINTDEIFKVRWVTTGASLVYNWTIWELHVTGEFSDDYDGTVMKILSNTSTVLTTDKTMADIYVHQGDEYGIAERNDLMIEDIFSESTTPFDDNTVETSGFYTYQSFEKRPLIEIPKSCMAVDGGAEFWNDVDTGFDFTYTKTFTVSGLTVTEAHVGPDPVVGGYASDSIVKKVYSYGGPAKGLSYVEEAGGFAAGDPERSFVWGLINSMTELIQKTKAILTSRGAAHFRGGIPIEVDTAAYQQLTVGQTVVLAIDLNANASPDIDENNVLVRKIRRRQAPGKALKTYIEVGATPLYVQEPQGRPSDKSLQDHGWAKRRGLPTPEMFGIIEQQAIAKLPPTDPSGVPGGQREIALDFAAEIAIRRDQADKFWTDDDLSMHLGTAAGDEDVEGHGDADWSDGDDLELPDITINANTFSSSKAQGMYIIPVEAHDVNIGDDSNSRDADIHGDSMADDDHISGDSAHIGASAFRLYESGGNLVLDATDGFGVTGTNDPLLQVIEDASNYATIYYDKSENDLVIESVAGGSVDNVRIITPRLDIIAAGTDCQLSLKQDDTNRLDIKYDADDDEAVYTSLDGGGHDDHYFHDNIYYDGEHDVFSDEDDFALLRAIKDSGRKNRKGNRVFDKESFPDRVIQRTKKGDIRTSVGGMQGFIISLLQKKDERITLLEEKLLALEQRIGE